MSTVEEVIFEKHIILLSSNNLLFTIKLLLDY